MGTPVRMLSASPNWYCSRASDAAGGLFGYAARNSVYLMRISPQEPEFYGELAGHTERVCGFAFSHYSGQSHLCASCSDDGSVKVWDVHTQSTVTEHKLHRNTISAIHWSPLVKDLLVTGDEKGIVVCFWSNRNDGQQFFPEPRTIFCLSCSPHQEDLVAVGYKDGMIVLIDISRRGEVVHRLRGHDEEIHCLVWCPHAQEEELHQKLEDSPVEQNAANGDLLPEMGNKGCYLASGSKDQTIRVWNSSTGKGVLTLKLPFLKRRGGGADPATKERLWLALHWPHGRPTQLVSSCFGGEMLLWDLTRSGKQKWSLLGSSEGQNHSRMVFNLCSLVTEEGRELLLSTSMDRDVKCWDLGALSCCWSVSSLGGFVYTLMFSPVAVGCLAVGVGDSMIRIWNTMSVVNSYDVKTLWQSIRSKVTALSWHPTKEGSLAFGTDDGKVGIYDAFSAKPPQISSTYHKKTVYSMCWGPPLPPFSFGAEGDRPAFTLYSCGGDGLIFQHHPWRLTMEAQDINKLIRDTNKIKHKLPAHTELSWKTDWQHLAIGNDDGSIEVFRAPHLQLICTIQQHHKLVNAVRWHHGHSEDPNLSFLLASGSNNAVIYVHNLKGTLENPSDAPVTITEPYRSLTGHTARITGLSWSPHHDAMLASASYDGTAQVWNVLQEEPVSNYRGHKGRLLCIQWSPVDPDQVWTGGDDFCLHSWSLAKQEHSRPPAVGRKAVELEKKRSGQPRTKGKKKKRTEGVNQDSVGDVISEERASPLSPAHNGTSDQEEEQETNDVVAADKTEPQEVINKTEPSQNAPDLSVVENRSPSPIFKRPPLRKEHPKGKTAESHGKKKKSQSLLPVSTSKDLRSKEEQHRDCVKLAAAVCAKADGAHTLLDDSVHLGLYSDRATLHRLMEEEGKAHLENGHPDLQHQIMLWKGDLKGSLQLAAERGELSDQLVALSPMAGYKTWVWAVEAYVKQLCFQEQYVKAASHLLSINKVYEAVQLLKGNHLYREAIVVAKSRLLSDDPVLRDLYTSWASVLERDGHYAMAAKCYLGASSPYDAAKVLAKKGDLLSLSSAAELASIAGEKELAASFAVRCSQEHFNVKNWVGAQQTLQQHPSLLGQRLLLSTSELLYNHIEDKTAIDWKTQQVTPCFHQWAASRTEDTFLSRLAGVWQNEYGVCTADQYNEAFQQLCSSETPPTTTNTGPKQLLLHISQEVALSALSYLSKNWDEAAPALLRTLSRCQQAGQFTLMQNLAHLLLPSGCEEWRTNLNPDNKHSSAACDSLQACLAYMKLYELWWSQDCRHSAEEDNMETSSADVHSAGQEEMSDGPEEGAPGRMSNDPEEGVPGRPSVGPEEGAPGRPSDGPEVDNPGSMSGGPEVGDPGSLPDFGVLLSELHAGFQNAQREIADVQKALREMIQQHQRNRLIHDGSLELEQDSDTSSAPPPEKCPDGSAHVSAPSPVSLTELMKKLSTANHKLAEYPEYLKVLPFPDVLESCLVLLHFPPSPVTSAVRAKAIALLQRYSHTSPDHHRAASKFLASVGPETAAEPQTETTA
ncbi:gem-associated protein 5 isoform X2 [Hyperolius riggenbachi]|uniref:gem-associated protein 5 isoform X2 n=1 Tax=Hyperolius riggenbachi TaxID=752182 RepID=UPI0035A27D38